MNEKREQEPSGHMTNNMEDVVFLGKQMERMRDGGQLEEDKRYPDPIQFDEEDHLDDDTFKRKN